MLANQRNIFFFLFALSGFSGLIYESIWTHYLKLFLGHAAYAQTLVLAIFMGGMAIGSWVCSRFSVRWKNLLLGYALAEGIIGLCALVFHAAFAQMMELSYTNIIPRFGNPLAASAFKWTLSALMILPQSVLLGMTFPLMSAGILRRFPARPGRSVALLYFTNSIGAAIGVLVSGFLLIRLAGLPGTIMTAGLINIVLALTVWALVRGEGSTAEQAAPEQEGAGERSGGAGYRFFLLASLVTGIASFIYEIGWIRMLSLVLGTSTHAFELMLSAFILGLAFGGLWIQRRIDVIASPVRYLAWVQLIMGLLALSTLLLYGNTFEVMQAIVKTLPKTDGGYALFNLSSSGLAMTIMLPTTFCAGMTLPLITFTLLRQGYGERSIGAVYAANTVGAILGVFFAIHLGMPLLGLKGLITFGAGLDIALGVALFWSIAAEYPGRRVPLAATALGAVAVAATLLFIHLDPYKMSSGVYRHGTLPTADTYRVLYHKDGKTATVSCFLSKTGSLSIRTNGKPDASITVVPGSQEESDEDTMILLGVMPMLFHPEARTVAVVGLGSGMTSHTLLSNPLIRQVDTVEIEKAMIEGANSFRPWVELVFTDPRSRIYNDDAKTFFSTYNRKYDLIVSEPSNPWVSGVAGLFSGEFYRHIQRHLHDDGLFVQWLQLYEINVDLVVSVLKAMSTNFSDFVVYETTGGDVVIIAAKNGHLREPDYSILNMPGISQALRRIHIEGKQDIAIRKFGSKRFLRTLLASYPIRANSDYYPVLDQNAARTLFLRSTALELVDFTYIPLPTFALLTGEVFPWKDTGIVLSSLPKVQAANTATAVRDYFLYGRSEPRYMKNYVFQQAVRLKQIFFERNPSISQNDRLVCLSATAVNIIPYLTPYELETIWKKLESGPSAAFLSVEEKHWYELFKAVSRRDADEIVAVSSALLKKADGRSLSTLKFIVASNMLGSLLQGNREDAFRLWTAYQPILFNNSNPDLLFRLLAAESTSR